MAKLATSEEETLIRASKEVHKWVGEEDMAKIVTEAGALFANFLLFKEKNRSHTDYPFFRCRDSSQSIFDSFQFVITQSLFYITKFAKQILTHL